jgi:serine/threonine protein kinase
MMIRADTKGVQHSHRCPRKHLEFPEQRFRALKGSPVSVECPHCQFFIKIKGVKTGRYTPKCPKCGKTFGLLVSGEEGNFQFTARTIETKAPSNPSTPKVESKPAGSKVVAPVSKSAAKPLAEPVTPPVEEDIESTVAALLRGEEIPEPPIASPSPPAEPEAPAGYTFAETEVGESANQVNQEATRDVAPADDVADFEVREAANEGDEQQESEEEIPSKLGGYEIIELLGKGGMGTVYLARQISLDRPVALKVMNPRWASDPVFVARFTREAYAAAQLVHHNVVQIYDIGQDNGVNYFSMEYVKGQTLSEILKAEGKLDVDVAVGYILQAARGLKAAHEQGMVHRDVKPDNLMLNDLGVVKVADLGLVKTPGSSEPGEQAEHDDAPQTRKSRGSQGSLSSMPSVTNVGSAMGTPTYMAPEQGMNAATVDHRADIYSLGCTLYVLVTGRVPFKGKTAIEVMTRHLKDSPIPPEAISKRVPPEVSAIILKMMAKKPGDRQADMSEVIEELEKFLGVSTIGPFSPSEAHADTLEHCVKGFNGASAARVRSIAIPAFYGGCAVLTLLCCFFSLRLAGGVLGLGLMTAVISFLVHGLIEKSYLFLKVREYINGSGPRDWLMWGATTLLVLLVLYMIGLLGYWVAFLVLSGAAAACMRVLIDKPLARQRKGPINSAERLLRELRLKGLPEESVRQFVCKYSGTHWEEFYEALFGYEALLTARKLWSRPEGGKPRPSHAAWRDPIVQWIDARQRARKEERERKHLQEVERRKLQAEGVSATEATARAAEAAVVMVSAAAEIKQQSEQRSAVAESHLQETEVGSAPINAKMLVEAAEKPTALPPEIKKKLDEQPKANPLGLIFGGTTRFALGAVLVALCFLWMNQNALVPSSEVDFKIYLLKLEAAVEAGNLAFFPAPLDRVLSGFHIGFAGLLLVLSILMRSRILLFFVWLSVIVSLIAPLVIPDEWGVNPSFVALLAGAAVAEFGVVFNRAARPRPLAA